MSLLSVEFDEIEARLARMEKHIMSAIDDLTAAVAAESVEVSAVVAGVSQLEAELSAAVSNASGADPALVAAVQQIQTNAGLLKGAVASIPAVPAPTPAPVPAPAVVEVPAAPVDVPAPVEAAPAAPVITLKLADETYDNYLARAAAAGVAPLDQAAWDASAVS